MTQGSAYDVKTFATDIQSEVKRLIAQIDLFWEDELRLFKTLDIVPRMQILDCGCGPGYYMSKLSKAFPWVKFQGVEIDDLLLEECLKRISGESLINCSVKQGAAEDTGFPDCSFDMVVSRLVVEHVADPIRALNEFYRILKPNGRLVIIDNDFENHLRTFPEVPELDDLYKAYCAHREADGGTPKIGRQLPSLMKTCGFSSLNLQSVIAHNSIVGDMVFLKAEGSGIPRKLMQDGYLDPIVLENLIINWGRMLDAPGHSIIRELLVCSGSKSIDKTEVSSLKGCDRENPELLSEAGPGDVNMQEKVDASVVENVVCGGQDIEGRLKMVWIDILNVSSVEKEDGFFEVGGDSLLIVQLRERIVKQFGVTVPLTTLFQYSKLGTMAEFISSSQAGNK